tara:strand:- start:1255 stop:1671 length:417 start_codon:yes stop_codon:yes gene_type:complete
MADEANSTNTESGVTPPAGTESAQATATDPAANPGSTLVEDTGAGAIPWEYFWLALAVAIFVVLWKTGKIAGIKKYILETREQLAKATWPTKDELKQHIVVVLISSVLLAAFTMATDFVLREIVWGGLMGSDTVFFDK